MLPGLRQYRRMPVVRLALNRSASNFVTSIFAIALRSIRDFAARLAHRGTASEPHEAVLYSDPPGLATWAGFW